MLVDRMSVLDHFQLWVLAVPEYAVACLLALLEGNCAIALAASCGSQSKDN